jgi:hypothetical protein
MAHSGPRRSIMVVPLVSEWGRKPISARSRGISVQGAIGVPLRRPRRPTSAGNVAAGHYVLPTEAGTRI